MLALLAGQGQLPQQICEVCQKQGRPLFIVAFQGQTDPNLVIGQKHFWTHLGAVDSVIQTLRSHGIGEVVMAGHIQRPAFSEIRLDRIGLKLLRKMGFQAFGDDGLLSGIVTFLEDQGFQVLSAADIIQGLLCPQGILGDHHPSDGDWQDIQRGVNVLRAMSQVDVGQAVIVQQGLVLGVEALEGTEQLLKRCRELHRKGPGGVLVKMAKQGQNHRVDLPTIGLQTILQVHAAHLAGLALAAGVTQILNYDSALTETNRLNLFMVGIDPL